MLHPPSFLSSSQRRQSAGCRLAAIPLPPTEGDAAPKPNPNDLDDRSATPERRSAGSMRGPAGCSKHSVGPLPF